MLVHTFRDVNDSNKLTIVKLDVLSPSRDFFLKSSKFRLYNRYGRFIECPLEPRPPECLYDGIKQQKQDRFKGEVK